MISGNRSILTRVAVPSSRRSGRSDKYAAPHRSIPTGPPGSQMTKHSYSLRAKLFGRERTYWLGADGLEWNDRNGPHRLPYAEIDETIVYKVRFLGSSATYWRCVLRSRLERRITLCAASYTGWRRIEDRTESYIPFIKELEARISDANPRLQTRRRGQLVQRTGRASRAHRRVGPPRSPALQSRPLCPHRCVDHAPAGSATSRASNSSRAGGRRISGKVRDRSRANSSRHVGQPRADHRRIFIS